MPRQPASLVERMFVLDEGHARLQCPMKEADGRPCEGVPHMRYVEFGRGVPVTSTSGPGMIVHFCCESEHFWELRLEDHSAGTWLCAVERTQEVADGLGLAVWE